MRIVLNVVIRYLEVCSIFYRNASLAIAVYLVVREDAIAGKPQPEPVVGGIGFISAVDISFAEHALKRIVWAMRGVVFFKQIVVTSNIDTIGGETCQEETIPTQACIISAKNIIAGLTDDKESSSIRAEMRTGIGQVISAAIIGVVVHKGAVRGVIEMKTRSAAVVCEVIDDFEVLTVITQDSVHLMLQIIVMNFGICDLPQKNPAAVRLRGRFPDIQK